MKLLILSCNTGEGHNSAAKAVQEYFSLNGSVCVIKDALSFWSQKSSKIISKGHVFIYRRLPKLFGIGYRFEENHPPKDDDRSLMYELVIHGCESLYEELETASYDAVICTHVFSAMMMTELKHRYRIPVNAYFVATDYTCSPGVAENDLDAYFIPHTDLTEEFVRNGVPAARLVASGIPVKQNFYERLERTEALRRLHLPVDRRIVLLTCGSMGCGPIHDLTEELPARLPKDVQLIVICGNNRRLYRALNRSNLPDNVTVIGYTTRMSLYMDAASLILTKPGGLSTTEAAIKRLPMIFIDAVPGCETRNLDFFVSRGFADTRREPDELIDLVCQYLINPRRLSEMSSALEKAFPGCAVQTVFEYISKELAYENT